MIKREKRTKFRNNIHFNSILLALIICMNANRYILGNSASNSVVYSIYVLFIAFNIYLNEKKNTFTVLKVDNPLFFFTIVFFSIYVLLRSIEGGSASIEAAVKLLVSFLIAAITSTFSVERIKETLSLTVLYNIVYGIVLYLTPNKASMMMRSGEINYLNITLTLGLTLSIALVYLILASYKLCPLRQGITYGAIGIFMLFVMTGYNSRGSILIPIACAAIILLIISPTKPYRLLGTIVLIAIIGYFGFKIYINNVSDYVYGRMMRLFNNTGEEMRVGLWREYWSQVTNRNWWILGGGTNSSRIILGYYPHNIFLQVIGEFGIIGVFASIVAITHVIEKTRCVIKTYRKIVFSENQYEVCVFYSCLVGFIYYLLNFMKSFSFYDACPLFVFAALVLNSTFIKQNTTGATTESSSL